MIRTLVVTCAVLALVPSVLPAQRGRLAERTHRTSWSGDHVEVGLIGGPNWNTVTGAGPVDAKYRGLGGLFLTVPVVRDLRIRPEVLVSGKRVGHVTEFQPPCLPPGGCPTVFERETASFTWLEVPLLAEVRFPGVLGRRSAPRLYGGPFLAVRLSCSLSQPLGGTQPTTGGAEVVSPCDPPTTVGPGYNNGDAGFVVGGTLAVRGIGVGARWTRSLVPIAPDQSVVGFGRLIGAKHSTLALTLELTTRLY